MSCDENQPKIEHMEGFGQQVHLSLPLIMLSCLLINSGLGVDLAQIGGMSRLWRVLALGAAAKLLVPIAFLFGVTQIMRLWHNPDVVQNILVGLALVASTPIAVPSAAWTQNANGSLALGLGLMLATTLLSPLTTRMALHSAGLMTTGDYSEDLHELANQGAGAFLAVAVVLPSVLGIGLRAGFDARGVNAVRPHLKLVDSAILPITLSLGVAPFSSEWLAARALPVDAAQRTSLMFGAILC